MSVKGMVTSTELRQLLNQIQAEDKQRAEQKAEDRRKESKVKCEQILRGLSPWFFIFLMLIFMFYVPFPRFFESFFLGYSLILYITIAYIIDKNLPILINIFY